MRANYFICVPFVITSLGLVGFEAPGYTQKKLKLESFTRLGIFREIILVLEALVLKGEVQ